MDQKPANTLSAKVAAIILAAPVLIYVLASLFVRLMADDFPELCDLQAGGPFELVRYPFERYFNWSGRFMAWSTAILIHLLPVKLEFVPAVLLILVWWLAIFLLARAIAGRLTLPNTNILAGLIASLLLGAILSGTPDVIQSIYWQAALVQYPIPLVLGTLFIWVVLQDRLDPKVSLLLCAVLAIVAGTYTEVYGLVQVILLGASIVIFARWKIVRQRLLVGLVFSILALAIVVAAPGNWVRRDTFPKLSLAEDVKNSIITAVVPGVEAVKNAPLSVVLLVLIPAVVASQTDHEKRLDRRLARIYLAVVLLAVMVVGIGTAFIGFYSMTTLLPGRAQIVPAYVVLAGLIVCGYLAGLSVNLSVNRITIAVLLVLVIAATVQSSAKAIAVTNALGSYASAYDQRASDIRAYVQQHSPASGQSIPMTTVNNPFGLQDFEPTQVDMGTCEQIFYSQ